MIPLHFSRDKMVDSGMELFWQQTAGTQRCGEAVIWRRRWFITSGLDKSPCSPGPSQLLCSSCTPMKS